MNPIGGHLRVTVVGLVVMLCGALPHHPDATFLFKFVCGVVGMLILMLAWPQQQEE